jgi:hypothetical protein
MEPIGDLLRSRRATLSALSIRPSPISTENLHARMGLEPLGESGGCPIRQESDWPPLFQIDQHRPIALIFTLRPIIHP